MTITFSELDLEHSYTIEEFMALPDNGQTYELVEGKLVEMQGPNLQHGIIILNLSDYLKPYVRQHQLGVVMTGTACVLDARAKIVRKPDLAFITAERLVGVEYSDAFPKTPDLAVEVISPSDKYGDVDEKIDEYLKAGTGLVWSIRPYRKVVEVFRQGEVGFSLFKADDELDGEALLPGFKLKVSALFDYYQPLPGSNIASSSNGKDS